MSAYYNEIDAYAAQWLRNLIKAGHIAAGDVDDRSITEVGANDLRGYTQCHFFAGIGVWSHALRQAGWPDDRLVWTGSCPCQPFSAAGKGNEFADERHLWPAWFRLIRECRPGVVFGEQVASNDALVWFDHVSTDLEAEGYTVGAVDSCAAGYGAPHIRQRLYFVADAEPQHHRTGQPGARWKRESSDGGDMGNAVEPGLAKQRIERRTSQAPQKAIQGQTSVGTDSPTNGFWSDAIWLPCRDGKARAAKPGIFPLAHGSSQRVGRLRAYGNAIVPQAATEFIKAFCESH